jgi:hypothetical protein
VLCSCKESNEWPTFQYPDLSLAQQPEPLDALSVLLSCPQVHYPSGMSGYGWFWVTDNRLGTPHPGDRIGLSVVGMSRIRDFALRRWSQG